MAENLDLPGRMAVRTPMQWQPGALGGFSTAPSPTRLCRPLPAGRFGPDAVNVVRQRNDPESPLSFVRQRIRRYRECPELGWGVVTILDDDVRSVLAHRCDWSGSTVLLCHNLGSAAETVRLTLVDQPKGVRCAAFPCGRGRDGRRGRHCRGHVGGLRGEVVPAGHRPRHSTDLTPH